MARNDIFVNINAISPADAFVTGQQDMTAADAPELILGDTPTFNFYFTDNTNTWPSWAGNAAYTVTWALSDAVSGDFAPAATTGNATPITGGWSIDLPLNAYDLVGLLNSKRISQAYPVTYLWQQIRVTAPSGKEVTRAMVYTPIRYRAISDTQNTESATPTGGRFVTVNNTNDLTTPTLAQFYDANAVPASALPLGLGTDTAPANGELLIGNGTGYVTSTLTAGTGVTITNGAGSITIDATGAQELLTATVKNAEAVPITKGQVVYLYSATGGFPSVKLAYNTGDATSAKTFGVVSDTSIAANGTGTVTCVGVVDGLNLGGFSDGDTVYLGATPGSITATKPYAPNHLVYVGIIERANAGNGELYVKVQNGYELDEIHDVQITSAPAAGALLMRDATNSLWKANRLSAGTNIAVTNADTSVTIGLTGTVAVANGGTGVTTSTGSGSVVLSTSPSLTTPILGTPQSGTLTNCTGLPVSTGVSGLGSGVATFLATPTSANLRTVVTDETGTGALVFANTPSLVTPDIGAATGTSATLTGNANVSDVRLGGASGPSAKSSIAARAARQGLVFDGTQVPIATSISTIGTGDYSWAAYVTNKAIPTAASFVVGVNDSGADFGGNRSALMTLADGTLQLIVASATTSLGAADTKTNLWVVTRSGTTLTIYKNGVSVATTTDSQTYGSSYFRMGGYATSNALWQGGFIVPAVYNRALTAAEVVSLYEAGVPSGPDYVNGGTTAPTGGTFLNYQYDTFTGASATGFTAAETGGQNCVAYSNYTSGVYAVGTKIKVTFSATLTSGATPSVYLANLAGTPVATSATVVAGSNSQTFTLTTATTVAQHLQLVFSTSGNTSYAISSVVVQPLGLLLAPDAAQAGGGLTWYDTSGNAANITLPASGVTWNVPSSLKTASGWTFGGNLTVSGYADLGSGGIGTPAAGHIQIGGSGSYGASIIGRGSAYDFGLFNKNGDDVIHVATGTTNVAVSGNLTVSGTGVFNNYIQLAPTSGAGAIYVQAATTGSDSVLNLRSGGSTGWTFGRDASDSQAIKLMWGDEGLSTGTLLFAGTTSGNVLLGTTTDSANGKLQLATHTTSAGGIGFGTDTALFRNAAGAITLSGANPRLNVSASTGTNPSLLQFTNSGGTVYCGSDDSTGSVFSAGNYAAVFGAGSAATAIVSGGVKAAVFDTSQNATFAGTGKFQSSGGAPIIINGAGTPIIQIGGTTASEPALRYDSSAVVGVVLANQSAYTSIKATAFTVSSDRRIKKNIADFSASGSLIDALRPRTFDIDTTKPMHADGKTGLVGFVAQELYDVFPQAVAKGDDGEEVTSEWGVDYAKLIPVLVAEIKSLRSRLAAINA